MTIAIRHSLSLGLLVLSLLITSTVQAAPVAGFALQQTEPWTAGASYLRGFDSSGNIVLGPIYVGDGVSGLSAGPSDSLYATENSLSRRGLIRIDASSGQTTAIGPSLFLSTIDYNWFDSTLYGIEGAVGATKQLYSFDLTNGNATHIATLTGLPGSFNQQRLAIRSDGVAYVMSLYQSTVNYGTLSLATGEFTNLGTTSYNGWFGDLAFDPNDDLFQLNNGTLFRVDQANFQRTSVAPIVGQAGLAFTARSVPEPALAGLLGTGAAWLFCIGRFRSKRIRRKPVRVAIAMATARDLADAR